ncbi:MAG: hypothetical protein IKT16_08825 [Desulfovibrio sp.]|nr:hypothetical protein [Desulfovibrio sp.]
MARLWAQAARSLLSSMRSLAGAVDAGSANSREPHAFSKSLVLDVRGKAWAPAGGAPEGASFAGAGFAGRIPSLAARAMPSLKLGTRGRM